MNSDARLPVCASILLFHLTTFNSLSDVIIPCAVSSCIQCRTAALSNVSLEVASIIRLKSVALLCLPGINFVNQAIEGGNAQHDHQKSRDRAIADLKRRIDHERV